MTISKSRALLDQLQTIESILVEYAIEELNIMDTKVLQQQFTTFKCGLERHIYAPKKGV